MHFKCTKCPNEFCSGCGESIKRGKVQQCHIIIIIIIIQYICVVRGRHSSAGLLTGKGSSNV